MPEKNAIVAVRAREQVREAVKHVKDTASYYKRLMIIVLYHTVNR